MSEVHTDMAFPFALMQANHGYSHISIGMTKREYFAAMAMQGLLASEYGGVKQWQEDSKQWFDDISCCAVESADALLKKLGEK